MAGEKFCVNCKYCYTLRDPQNALKCGEIGRYFEPKDL